MAIAAAEVESLRAYLQQHLPEYMVPSALVVLEKLPLTANGKMDRKSAAGCRSPEAPDAEYGPPEGETEELLAEIWQVLLRVKRVGREDNFFELGGHSLLATQLVSRIRETFSNELPLRQVFEHPDAILAGTCDRASERRRRTDGPAHGGGVTRCAAVVVVCTAAAVVFAPVHGTNAVYNVPLALRLRGETNEAALVRSLEELHRRHESLRTRFEAREGSAVQVIDAQGLELEVEAVSAAEVEAIVAC